MKFSPNILKSIFLDDLGPKGLAILCATMLWYYVNILSLEKTYLSLPISAINVPSDLYIEYQKTKKVQLELQTREDITEELTNLSAVINLEEYQLGRHSYPIEINNLPSDVYLIQTPETMYVTIEEYDTKQVPIKVQTKGLEQENISFITSPREITVRGRKSVISKMTVINTFPIDDAVLSLIQSNIITNIGLNVPKGVTGDKNKVNIFIEKIDLFNVTNYVEIPIKIVNLDPNLKIAALPTLLFTVLTKTNNIASILPVSSIQIDMKGVSTTGLINKSYEVILPNSALLIDTPETISLVIESNVVMVENMEIPDNIEQDSISDENGESESSNTDAVGDMDI